MSAYTFSRKSKYSEYESTTAGMTPPFSFFDLKPLYVHTNGIRSVHVLCF